MMAALKRMLHQGAESSAVWCRETLRWRSPPARGSAPSVYYGYPRLPRPGDPTFGGLVKCLDLAAHFPNQPRGANLLYLVSSALPPASPVVVNKARQAGARLVLNQNGVFYPGWFGPGWERLNRPLQHVLHRADHVLYQSEFSRLSSDRYLGPRQGSSEILYNAVDTRVFVPASPERPASRPVLLLAGSHWAFYRVESAIRTLALVRRQGADAQLIVAGRYKWRLREEEARAEAEAMASSCGVGEAVHLIGPYSQTSALALLQSADLLLHTKYNDPCPRLVLEAMACGLPVVYSASGGLPELVGAEAGWGIPAPLDWERDHPPAAEDVAEGVFKVLQDRARFATAARRRAVECFDVQPWIERHRAVFAEVLARKRGSP